MLKIAFAAMTGLVLTTGFAMAQPGVNPSHVVYAGVPPTEVLMMPTGPVALNDQQGGVTTAASGPTCTSAQIGTVACAANGS
jgi:hypothetical protein